MAQYATFGSPHKLRRQARKDERRIQELLDTRANSASMEELRRLGVPSWANGATVKKAGSFQHIVVLTENVGH